MSTPSSAPTTTGELIFQDYLKVMQYPYEFEREFSGKSKRPDYTVTKNGLSLFDVKDFAPFMPVGFGAYDPYPRIREKIEEGREKFREFKEYPCSLVLKNNGHAFVHLESPDIMLGSMYGDAGFTFPLNASQGTPAGPMKRAFLGRGKMVRPNRNQNTTISSLITLRYVNVGMRQYRTIAKRFPSLDVQSTLAAAATEFPNFDLGRKQLGVIVWENAFARIPLSRELFDGPYDVRWGYERGQQMMIFRGRELESLEEDDE